MAEGWQAYVDSSLLGTGNIDKAVICGVSDWQPWATSAGFNIPDAERKAIAQSFDDTNSPKKIVSEGLKINGEKYMVIEATDDSIKAKKGKEGLVVLKTKQAILIAHHPADVQTPTAYSSVVELQEYLLNVGY
ncbi:Profilin/allergen [Lophiostoma macrostomum CBS 122681]|uniref:Profilin n=1 Tax=Lophiostoma macrostomum CBS 122681 TaxID=1314788 RepID=A0A6A6T5P0_9PLEO|nr:Profilin/allergen [Lophiostoma macrostomum CBS 122681]